MMKVKPGSPFIILILGALMTVSPFSIDMYLPAFSQIAKDLNTTVPRISLSVTSYFVGFALGQLLYGPLLDKYGRKKPLYYGLSFYLLSCLGCMLSQSVEALIIFRFIQALGGCVAMVAAIAMVRDFFPVQESAKVLSLLMLILGLSPLLAPTAGGFVVTWLGWRWVFIALLLIVLLILFVIVVFLPKGYTPDPTVSLRAKPMLNTFWTVLKNPVFFTYAVAGAFSFASMFVYVAGSPIIFMELYHVSPQTYGFIFALLSVGFVGSNQLNVLLLRKYSSIQLFRVAILAQFIILLVFLAGAFNNWYGLTATIVMLFLSLSCLGFTYPNASAIALSPFTRNIGSASALIGFLQIGVAGIASACIGLFNANKMGPIVAVMAATSFVAVSVLTAGKRKISVSAS